jgi:putative mRNA 3-end processing factor
MGVKLKFLGGALEVGKQGLLVSDGDTNILLDYGSTVSEENPKFPEHVRPSDVDAVVLSHAHLDHSGALPYLYVSFGPEVFMTPPTLDLARLLLRDFLNISGSVLPYEFLEVEGMTRRAALVEYQETVSKEKFEISTANAGHIPGSMMTTLRVGSKTVFFTGDFNLTETRLLEKANVDGAQADAVVMEATYSDKDHPKREDMEKELVLSCNQIVENGGTVLIPAFSVGRSHEIVSVLRAQGFKHQIHIDGMAREAAEIIMEHPSYLRDPREFEKSMESVNWIEGWRDRKKAVSQPGVIVSPAGMLRGGAAAFYIDKVAFSKKNGVFIVSYQAAKTPGRMLLDTGSLYFHGEKRSVDAAVKKFDFSSHSGKKDLEGFIKSLKGQPHVYLIHGEGESLKKFSVEMTQSTGLQVQALANGDTVEIG